MQETHTLAAVPDDELLRRLTELVRDSRRVEADVVAHIAAVDERRLHARYASPTMFAYCREVLHLSEAEAHLRVTAARASREHPVLLVMLGDGRLHLSAIALLAPHLTAENRDAVLARATYRSKRQIEELVAEIAPRPDAPAFIRRLPGRTLRPLVTASCAGEGPAPAGAVTGCRDTASESCRERRSDAIAQRWPVEGVCGSPADVAHGGPAEPSGQGRTLRPSEGAMAAELGAGSPCVETQPPRPSGMGKVVTPRAVIEPLAPARYRVQFTASEELRDKLERLRVLLRSEIPDGDLGAIIEQAVSERLARLEARRFGRTSRPRHGRPLTRGASPSGFPVSSRDLPVSGLLESSRDLPASSRDLSPSSAEVPPSSRHIPAAVRRVVRHRDGDQCCYVDETGRRCSERGRLEYHHRHPFGVGGTHSPANLCLLCHTHNRLMAEHDYGRKAIARHRRTAEKPPATIGVTATGSPPSRLCPNARGIS